MATFGNILAGGTNVSAPPSGDKAVSAFVLDRQGTLDHLLFAMGSSGATSVRAVVYDNSGSGGNPGALVGVSNTVSSAPASTNIVFSFSSPPTLNAGTYWIGLITNSGGTANCIGLTNGIAYNADTGPSNPFGTPSLAPYQYPEVMFYTPVLAAGTYYGQLLGGDLTHAYSANVVTVLQIVIPVAGSISKLTTFLQAVYSGAKAKGVIYDNTGPSGGPGTLLGTSTELVGIAINGNDLVFPSAVSLAAGTYYIGLHCDTTMFTWHLNDSTPNAVGTATYTSGVPGTFPSATDSTGSWPLWATFAPSGGGGSNQPILIACT